MNTKLLRILRVLGVATLIVFYVIGHDWRSNLLARMATQEEIKKPDVSVSVSEQGHVVRVEGLSIPGRPASPCSATLRFDVAPQAPEASK